MRPNQLVEMRIEVLAMSRARGAPDEIEFTIRNGRVVEILSTLDG